MKTLDGKDINNDGLMSLLDQFDGDRHRFLEFAMRNVYFINPEKAYQKWLEQKAGIEHTGGGIIRHSTKIFKSRKLQAEKEYLLKNGKLKLMVTADSDGNTAVRNMFCELTGILSSYGAKSNVKNYTLAHIWGLTNNPYTFTAPWNIALVPTFIAPLTDGKYDETHVRHVFQSTFRATAWLLYDNIIDFPDWVPENLHPNDEYLEIAHQLIDEGIIKVLA